VTLERLRASLADRYRLERELGQGGMATVYLAQDLKHQRQVAIKVLKPELAAVLGAERFVQEITTTAQLQHPHILPLFDSGTADSFLYYVMPYVQGETLRAKLDREKQLGVEEAVKITREVADALDYAHRQGVVHRDIKPENILLHDGRPMVADFGIALAVSAAAGGRMTETGLSLGTPHYMSPEQATAEKEITARSDVYSLASVLYEMLAGQPPHLGGSAQQIIMKIIAEPAAAVTSLRKSVPSNVAAALAKALEKLPADRFDSARAFAEALGNSGFQTTTTAAGAGGLIQEGGRWRRIAVGAMALAAACTGLAIWGWWRPAPTPPVLRYAMALPAGEQLGQMRGNRLALSPDGSRLVYVGPGPEGTQLWSRFRNQLHATPIPGTDRAFNPFFSPDGSRVGYVVADQQTKVQVVGFQGAPPITVADSGLGHDGGTWSADGFIYIDGLTAGGITGLMRVSPTGGRRLEQVTTVDTAAGELDHYWPVALPGKQGVLFTVEKRGSKVASDVAVLDLGTLQHHVLFQGLTARYSASGHLVYVTAGGDLMAVPFDLDRLKVTGEPFAVTGGVARREFGAVDLALSPSGTLLYQLGDREVGTLEPVYVGRDGGETVVDSALSGDIRSLALSPDGRQLAVSLFGGTDQQVWIKQLPVGPFTKLTFDGSQSHRPTWSPDGRNVGYISNANGQWDLYRKRADGVAAVELVLAHPDRPIMTASWSRDGRWVVYQTYPPDIFARGPAPDTTVIPLLTSPNRERFPRLSPDGRWLAYQSDESGDWEVYVRPFPDVESGRWQVSVGGGGDAQWAHSGRELFYWNRAGRLESVEVIPGATFATGRHTALFDGTSYAGDFSTWDITPDDRRFVLLRPRGGSVINELVVVENFSAELAAPRAP
jgi:Tol biopolymer transport system component/tRNA A-37 threonylcarbamoyl transferase component Bud32